MMKMVTRLLALSLVFSLLSCGGSKTTQGGAIGAGAGGVIGGIIGKRAGNTAAGAIIGAAIGGTAGAAIGRYMDKQAAELEEELENAKVERVGEGIKVTFDSGILFDFDSDNLRGNAKDNLEEMSRVLKKYDDTNILVVGHTDSIGSNAYNEELSEERAESVAEYLATNGIRGQRITEEGKGESDPVATNKTEAGRQQNRRVEVAIFANEDLKERAEDGTI